MEISKKLKDKYAENRHLVPEVRKFAASGAFVGASVAGIGGVAAGAAIGLSMAGIASSIVILKELKAMKRKD